jgi:hypothetical protein
MATWEPPKRDKGVSKQHWETLVDTVLESDKRLEFMSKTAEQLNEEILHVMEVQKIHNQVLVDLAKRFNDLVASQHKIVDSVSEVYARLDKPPSFLEWIEAHLEFSRADVLCSDCVCALFHGERVESYFDVPAREAQRKRHPEFVQLLAETVPHRVSRLPRTCSECKCSKYYTKKRGWLEKNELVFLKDTRPKREPARKKQRLLDE